MVSLADIGLTLEAAAGLSPNPRRSVIGYLLRWEAWAEGRALLERVVEEKAGRLLYRAQLAEACLGLGDLPAARPLVADLCREYPDKMTAVASLGDLLLAENRPAEALVVYRGLLAFKEESPMAAGRLALAYAALGDWPTVLAEMEKLVAYYSDRPSGELPPRLVRLLIHAYRHTGQEAQAKSLETYLSGRFSHDTARMREEMGKPGNQAVTTISKAVETEETPAIATPLPEPVAEPSAPTTLTTQLPAPPTISTTQPTDPNLQSELRRLFGYDSFRSGQEEVIGRILAGQSVLAVMPTGAGKSLCYQLPAMLLPGATLVISPLIALMKDQVDNLPAPIYEKTTFLNSSLEQDELERRLAGVAAGRYKLVYAAPERLRQRPFVHTLGRAHISLLVIDEAHCVSLWGHDFRPDYLFISKALPLLGNPTLLAMTATATPAMRREIGQQMGKSLAEVSTGTYRPNLRLEVQKAANEEEKLRLLVELVRREQGSGIVYATAREKCEDLAALLRKQGVKAIHYHAGMERQEREQAQETFMLDRARVVCATVAFGMGIDKANIRFILHFNLPESLEAYYQEAGRAGRDGKPSRCVLLYSSADKGNLTRWLRQAAVKVDHLRAVYRQIKATLPGGAGPVNAQDLQRECGLEESQARVAVSLLEKAGLLVRHLDLPRVVTVEASAPTAGEDGFADFVARARLRPGQQLSINSLELAQRSGLPLVDLEERLLVWQEAGLLRLRGSAREMLIELKPPPADIAQRIERLLDGYDAAQQARIDQMAAYAASSRCRHAVIAAHFGEKPPADCRACDNCLGLKPRRATEEAVAVPAHLAGQSPALLVLKAMTDLPIPLGKRGLSRLLKGSIASAVQAQDSPYFGALAWNGESSIEKTIGLLVQDGLLAHDTSGEFPLLTITAAGHAVLAAGKIPPESDTAAFDAKQLAYLAKKEATPQTESRPSPPKMPAPPLPFSALTAAAPPAPTWDTGDLFERLRAWRRAEAAKAALPPFMILPDVTLREIAQRRPLDLTQLSQVKGIGTRKLEQYGQAILDLLRE